MGQFYHFYLVTNVYNSIVISGIDLFDSRSQNSIHSIYRKFMRFNELVKSTDAVTAGGYDIERLKDELRPRIEVIVRQSNTYVRQVKNHWRRLRESTDTTS